MSKEPRNLEIKNAVIKSASLNSEDGPLRVCIHLDYGGAGQGFGPYDVYLPKEFDNHCTVSTAGHFIFRVMEIAGVLRWNDLPGRCIRVNADHSGIEEIGHIIRDDWFSPRKDFAHLDGLTAPDGGKAGPQ